MNTSLSLRIAAIFIMFVASMIGILFPLIVDTKNDVFKVLNAGSAGIMLGLALMHLLPDSDETLGELFPDYGWAFAITAGGVILILAIEQTVFIFASQVNAEITKNEIELAPIPLAASTKSTEASTKPLVHTYDSHDHSHGHGHDHHDVESAAAGSCCNHNDDEKKSSSHHCTQPTNAAHSHFPTTDCAHDHDGGHDHAAEEAQVFSNVLKSSSLNALITAYVMEISIAVHSIIIGVDLGLLVGDGHVATLISLIVAMAFHQLVEGVGLGSTIQTSRASLGNAKVAGFVFIFSCTMPLGVLIGILTSGGEESDSDLWGKGVADALAAGSLLYISLTEMVGNYFHAHDLAKKPFVKLSMVLSFAVGVVIMALIAVWA